MQSKIIFLGTAGDAISTAKQMRSSGGIVIESESGQFHLDPGPGSLVKAKLFSINTRETTAVLCTNDELWNSNDLNAIISAMSFQGMDRRGIAVINQGNTSIKNEYEAHTEKTIRMQHGKRIGINDTDIFATFSTKEHSNGFLFHFPGFTLGYVSDTGYDDQILKEYKNVNILILKCKNPEDIEEKDVLNIEECKKIIEGCKPDLAVLTSFGVKMLETDLLNQARDIQKSTGVQTISANDGLKISPASYSKGNRQKTLSGF